MGDRICIRIHDSVDYSPVFYGHWCGLRGLKVMNEMIRKGGNDGGNIMCNFIREIMPNGHDPYNFYIYNDNDNARKAADGDQYCWTYYCTQAHWVTTNPLWCDRTFTVDELDDLIKSIRPCLYRECPCVFYGGKAPYDPRQRTCEMAFWDQIDKGMDYVNTKQNEMRMIKEVD